MKRFATAVILISGAAAVFASGVENKTNMSTGYLRNPSRNTEAKRPEASYWLTTLQKLRVVIPVPYYNMI